MREGLSIGRIWVNEVAKFGKTKVVSHSLCNLRNQVSRSSSHNCCSNDLVCALVTMDLHNSFNAITSGSVELVVVLDMSIKSNSLLLQLMRVLADVGHFRGGISAPRKQHLGVVLLTEEKCVADHIFRADV